MSTTLRLSQELSAGPARIRVDVHGPQPVERVLEDSNFLDYRLADVRVASDLTLGDPDIVWDQDAPKAIAYDGRRMTFSGPWPAGPIQKVIVTMLALRLEALGLHPFHSAGVRYRDRTILFLGGESNHGKSLALFEACRRGAMLVSSETTVIDETGIVVLGSKEPFVRKRAEGTERADKAPDGRLQRFFGSLPTWEVFTDPSRVDLVVLPAIDGNFESSCVEMGTFERQYQTFHSVQNYFLADELLAPGIPMPIVDTEALRRARADFVERFAERPYFLVRAATPQALMDEVDRVL